MKLLIQNNQLYIDNQYFGSIPENIPKGLYEITIGIKNIIELSQELINKLQQSGQNIFHLKVI